MLPELFRFLQELRDSASRHAVPRGLVASCGVLLVVEAADQRWQ